MSIPDYIIPLIVATPLLGAFLTPLIGKLGEKIRNSFVIGILGLTAVFVFLAASDIFSTGIPRIYVFGAADLNIPVVRILFEVDGISIFMAIISIFLAFIAAVYSWSFMKENDGLDKYYTLMLLLVAGMLGMQLTGDLFNFFVFLEITCISSCALIAFWVHKGEALEAAFKYIVISSIGALFVLFAIGLLYAQYHALNIAVIANALQITFLDKIALVIFLVVLGMKAGLAPMHMWLPDSYSQAPPSVMLIIIGATLASVYGLLRVCFTLYGKLFFDTSILTAELFGWVLVGLAILTIIIGVLMALIQTDFMRLIGFAAVAEVGYILLGVGVCLVTAGVSYGRLALEGSIFHILNDSLDVGLLFLVAGAVFYATKHRCLDNLSGLARQMKYTTVFFVIGFLAISGMPPMNGFASKLILYQSTFQLNPILGIIAILCSILILAVFVKVFYSVFLGPKISTGDEVKEVPVSMLCAMGAVSICILIIGLFPNIVLEYWVQPAADALINYQTYISQIIIGGL